MDKSYSFLKSPIGSGGAANIYTVRIRPELVANVGEVADAVDVGFGDADWRRVGVTSWV